MLVTGSFVSEMSGSLGGIVASRNKGGQYLRQRAVPTTSTTPAALQAKAFLASASAAWTALTQTQRDSWTRFGGIRSNTNRLGQQKILAGIAAHNAIYTRMSRAGLTPLTEPPIGTDPDALASATGTYDIGTGTSTIAYTPTPLGADDALWVEAAVVDSPGIEYVANVQRLVAITAAAAASPYDYQAAVEAVFGPLVVGQKVVLFPHVFDTVQGLLSQPLRLDGIVTDTP